MIDSVLNLIFRCPHRHLTRPFTPQVEQGVLHDERYVVCLDCTKQFAYDLKEMRMGKAIDRSDDACVIPPHMPKPLKTKLAYALSVAVPVGVLVGVALTAKKPVAEKDREKSKPDPGQSRDAADTAT